MILSAGLRDVGGTDGTTLSEEEREMSLSEAFVRSTPAWAGGIDAEIPLIVPPSLEF
jgi:hypothetical protein